MKPILFSLLFCLSAFGQFSPLSPFSTQSAPASGGASSYALVFHTAKGTGGGGSGTTDAIDTSGATLIVAAVGYYSAGGATPFSDSKGNTWTPLTARGSGTYFCRLFYCVSPTVGAGHTFSTTGDYNVISVAGFSGNAGSPFDAESGANDNGVTAILPGSITPAASGELFVTALTLDRSSGSVDSGFTLLAGTVQAGGDALWSAFAYKIKVNGTAENPTWSQSFGGNNSCAMGAFK